MCDAARAGHRFEVETVEQFLRGRPELLPSADLDRRDGDMHGVDQIRLEELTNRRDTTTDAYVLALGGVLGLPQRLGGRRVDEMERSVGEGEAGSVMVGEHEHGGVEGRVVSPPPLPVVVLPGAALWR